MAEQIPAFCRMDMSEGCLFVGAGRKWLDAITLNDIERAISVQGVEHHQFSLLAEDAGLKTINAYQYVERFNRLASPALLLEELIKQKRTLLFRHFHRRCPAAAAVFTSLVNAGFLLDDVVAILSPPNSIATTPHADGHAILQLQLSGEKVWRYWGIVEDERIEGAKVVEELRHIFDEKAANQPATQLTLRPGDMLFLPKRMLHHAKNGDAFSLSLSFQFASRWSNSRPSKSTYGPSDVFGGAIRR
ncbi:JmjC domain-containing protein [Xanthobacter sp. AM11]|uniref:JmjC domain-containing protein n=1 Tax=Xanthobacter sp. AM11 TaxID=3380643 RepID=UPI0039BFF069